MAILFHLSLLSLVLVAVSLSARADTALQTATAHCDAKSSLFSVVFNDVLNPFPEDIREARKLETKGLSCRLGRHVVRVYYRYIKASSSGICGALPGGFMTASIDDAELLTKVFVNNSCTQTVRNISFHLTGSSSGVLSVCGAQGDAAQTQTCVEVPFLLPPSAPFPLDDYRLGKDYLWK